ncbi:hypothetical protein ACCO45_007432 [Purpureocillium lilacinum]|uniref:Uncharacterized protein n=1 Tax=Purpureocillium lilacinum TaxID=33203 RepID=A0ACC4DVB2_PURLI
MRFDTSEHKDWIPHVVRPDVSYRGEVAAWGVLILSSLQELMREMIDRIRELPVCDRLPAILRVAGCGNMSEWSVRLTGCAPVHDIDKKAAPVVWLQELIWGVDGLGAHFDVAHLIS